jgi:hypothetical protein
VEEAHVDGRHWKTLRDRLRKFRADTTKTASASITLVPVSLSIAPLSEVLSASQLQEFTATVLNTSNVAVTWSINPSLDSCSCQSTRRTEWRPHFVSGCGTFAVQP